MAIAARLTSARRADEAEMQIVREQIGGYRECHAARRGDDDISAPECLRCEQDRNDIKDSDRPLQRCEDVNEENCKREDG